MDRAGSRQRAAGVGASIGAVLLTAHGLVGQEAGPPPAFLEWAEQVAVPVDIADGTVNTEAVEAIAALIGDARVVALSEGVHGAAEPLVLRNELFEHLVTEMGFSAIAIESGLAEGRVAHEFVRGAPGDIDDVVARSFSWGFHRFPQNRALVEWLRAYNATQSSDGMVDFYGFDVPGSPGNPAANRGMRTGLEEALAYLASVDSAAAAGFRPRLPSTGAYAFDPRDERGYPLAQAERDRVSGAIADLVSLLRREETRYVRASSPDAHAWGLRTAIAARQADDWLRQVPQGWGLEDLQAGDRAPYADGLRVRDRAQADNIRWILDREGPDSRILVFAANLHTVATPMTIAAISADEEPPVVAGAYLERWLGDDYFPIGNTVRSGSFGCGTARPVPDIGASSITTALGDIPHDAFLLDLSVAEGPVAAWLDGERELFPGALVHVSSAFEALVHINVVTPACP